MAGLYVHIPFCERKCIYCDFYSVEHLEGADAFVDALEEEIVMYASYDDRETFDTIYFGGGTPSLLHPAQLERIIRRLRTTYRLSVDVEVTLEVNPGTADASKLAAFRSSGVNRLSIGIQSFHDDELRLLTRTHSVAQAVECVHAATEVGFENLGIDLIFALPGQTHERWRDTLNRALEIEPQHISAYSLIVEPGTPLARLVKAGLVSPLPEEHDAEMFMLTMDVLRSAGFEHYEVSNYARPGLRSRHNSMCWSHSNYLGFGPSAHSFWSLSSDDSQFGTRRRWWNSADLGIYVEKTAAGFSPVAGSEVLAEYELMEEYLMLGLRSDGIDLEKLERVYHILPSSIEAVFAGLVEHGLAELGDGKLRLTDRGFPVCDEIVQKVFVAVTSDVARCAE